ncbi:unnamed protein product [Microthlaspi erraticum]|uniref:AWPM-19-like family protein n=1 Tax=Microthlaspi erraticum TaxID=1685480 RepID=A0A6D2HGT7_9BRAS|nr:unnamed protein product [Microthlaspi erraticum]
MVEQPMKPVASLLLVLNFCMYAIVLGIGAWSMNKAINHGFLIGADFSLPTHFSPIYFPMGNAATGFFVMFALIAGVAGAASVIAGASHLQSWTTASLPAAVSAATIAWSLTLLAMGFGCKEIELGMRNARLVKNNGGIFKCLPPSAITLFFTTAITSAFLILLRVVGTKFQVELKTLELYGKPSP